MGMENFEQFRKQIAETIKLVPKNERKNVLEEIKKEDPKKYQEAKELKEAKMGLSELSKTETLINPENPDEVADWIKAELDSYTEERSGYVMSSHLKDIFEKVVEYLAKKLNITIERLNINDIVKCNERTSYLDGDSNDEGKTSGSLSLMRKEIFRYGAYSDGSSFSIGNWEGKNLKSASAELIGYLKNQKK